MSDDNNIVKATTDFVFGAFITLSAALVLAAAVSAIMYDPKPKPVKTITINSERVGRATGKASRGFFRGFVDGLKKGNN